MSQISIIATNNEETFNKIKAAIFLFAIYVLKYVYKSIVGKRFLYGNGNLGLVNSY